jgi:hypothetical protein
MDMSINLNPSGIVMSYAGDRFKDKSGDTKVLKIKFPSRTTESKELEEVSLGEFISFIYPLPANERNQVTPKEGRLLDRISIFLYADPSKKIIKAVELKNYMLRLTDDIGKPITISEGLNFIKTYIQNAFNQEEDIEYSLLKNTNTIGEKILLKKDNFKSPVASTYTRFEKTFFGDRNQKQVHFKSFIRTYDISRIRNLEKVVLTEQVLKDMQSAYKVSKRNGI